MKERTNNRKIWIAGLILTAVALTIVFLTEQVLKPGYWIKSAVKVASFGGAILLYVLLSKKKPCEVINLHKPKSIRKLLLCIVGLAAVGLFLQFLSVRYRSVAAGWIVHASANVAINTIGALLIFEVL